MPFENGWICRECWSANREQDDRCYRCHSVPKRQQKPEAITFATPDGKPNEDRKKVSSLTGPRAEQAPAPSPAAAATPRRPLLEQIGVLAIVAWARTGFAAIAGAVARVMSFGRAVGHAPGAGARRVSRGVREARDEASSRARSALSHRRAWLSTAWVVSALSCALLFSAALHAPFAASLLVVISIAILSGLTAAITSNVRERQARGMMERSNDAQHAAERTHVFVPAPERPSQPADAFGSRSAR